jgi:hypothetical protein
MSVWGRMEHEHRTDQAMGTPRRRAGAPAPAGMVVALLTDDLLLGVGGEFDER